MPAGLDVAVYDVIGAPPLFAGAVNGTYTEVPDAIVAVPIVGAPGTDGNNLVNDLEVNDASLGIGYPYGVNDPNIVQTPVVFTKVKLTISTFEEVPVGTAPPSQRILLCTVPLI